MVGCAADVRYLLTAPRELGGLGYGINSASLWFLPRNELESGSYGEVRKLSAKKGERI